jgi:hypothetical protein
MARTLSFLASIQDTDGSYYETEAKLAHSPQEWLQTDPQIDRFYFTAAVPMRLCSVGHGEHAVVRPALEWLRASWGDWKLVTGTWYNLWALLCLCPALTGLSGTILRRCYAQSMDWLPHLGPQPVTWLLDSLHGAGYPKEEPLVAAGMSRLAAVQHEDGTWQHPHTHVETTVTALRLLHDYGVGLE